MNYLKISKNTLNHLPTHETAENQPSNKRKLCLTVGAIFTVGIIYGQQRIAYPLFLNDTFNNFTLTAILFWLDPLTVALFQVKITKLFIPIKVRHQLAIGGFLLGVGLFALTFVHSLIGAILACLVFILGEMLFMPTTFVQCYEAAGTKRKGMAAGAWRSAYASGLIVGPVLSGLLMQYYSYNACWFLAGGLGLFLSILFLGCDKEH